LHFPVLKKKIRPRINSCKGLIIRSRKPSEIKIRTIKKAKRTQARVLFSQAIREQTFQDTAPIKGIDRNKVKNGQISIN